MFLPTLPTYPFVQFLVKYYIGKNLKSGRHKFFLKNLCRHEPQ